MFQPGEYNRIRRQLLGELRKHWLGGVAPKQFVRLRLFTYYDVLKGISIRWLKFGAAIQQGIQDGDIVGLEEDDRWIALPTCIESSGSLRAELVPVFKEQKVVKTDWAAAAARAGYHLEKLFREDCADVGYTISKGGLLFRSGGETINIDAFFMEPKVVVELKNQLSDVFHAPDITPGRTSKDLRKIERVFRWAKDHAAVPILMAPHIDATFYGFQEKYGGYSLSTLFQVLPASEAGLAERIRRVLRYSHVVASDSLPKHIRKRFAAVMADIVSRGK